VEKKPSFNWPITQEIDNEIDASEGGESVPQWYHQCLKDGAMRTNIPPFILKVSFLLALTGGFIGVLIGWNNGESWAGRSFGAPSSSSPSAAWPAGGWDRWPKPGWKVAWNRSR
jgi:hypothetical protein